MPLTQSSARNAGFTLVELVVVMLVSAILIAVAVPTYQAQIRHSRRTDAKTALLDLAAREEKYMSLNNTYTASPANLGYVAASATTATFPQTVGSGYYQVNLCLATPITTSCTTSSAAGALGPTYIVSATPQGQQANDTTCLYFAVDNTGTQYSSNSISGVATATTSTCWQ